MSILEGVFEHHASFLSISPQFSIRFLMTLYANDSALPALFNGEIRAFKVTTV